MLAIAIVREEVVSSGGRVWVRVIRSKLVDLRNDIVGFLVTSEGLHLFCNRKVRLAELALVLEELLG